MGKHKKYSSSIKLKAVKIFLEGKKSASAIAMDLGIHTPKRIEQWVASYEKYGEEGFAEERRGKLTGVLKGRPRKSDEQKELEYLRAKVALLEALVDQQLKKK